MHFTGKLRAQILTYASKRIFWGFHFCFSKTKLSRLRTQYTQLHQLTDYEIELILRIVIKPDSSSYYIDELKAIQKILDVNGVTIAQLINFTEQVQV